MTTVDCGSCHRRERWASGRVDVILPGGQRRPTVHPTWNAWRILKRVRHGDLGPVVGACSACGQPLVASGPALALPEWMLETPLGNVAVGAELEDPNGTMSEEDVDRFLEGQFRQSWARHLETESWFGGVAGILLFAVPFFLWLVAMSFAVSFMFGALSHL